MMSSIEVPLTLVSKLTTTATLAALRAGDLLRKGFGTSFSIHSKDGHHNLVTEYDEKSEAMIIDMIQKQFPEHCFLCEESGASGKSNDTIQWIIDPLDGTVNFAHGIPCFCVSIAACYEKHVLCGVIYNPMTEELFIAEKNRGAFLNGTPLKVSSVSLLSDGFLATGFPYNVNENPGQCLDQFFAISKMGIPVRRLGSAALDLAYTAAGKFDGYWEVSVNPWDYAAGMLLVEEAGGKVTNYLGQPVDPTKTTSMVATNGLLHTPLLSQLSSK